jgi:hypothetical protein
MVIPVIMTLIANQALASLTHVCLVLILWAIYVMVISAFKILTVPHPLALILFVSHVAKPQEISAMDILVHMMLIVHQVLV